MRSIKLLSLLYVAIIFASIYWAWQVNLDIADWLALLGVWVFGAVLMFEIFDFIIKSRERKLEHSKDLVNKVLREWLESEWDLLTNEYFPEASEHIRTGYPNTWNMWKQFKDLSLECETQSSNIRTKITKKIKDWVIIKVPTAQLTERALSLLVTDVRDYAYHKVKDGRSLLYFDIEYFSEPKLYKLVTMQKEGSYYRGGYDVESSSKIDIERMVEMMNSILGDTEINEEIKSLQLTEEEKDKMLKQFRNELRLIIKSIDLGKRPLRGKCRLCP